MSRLSKLLGLVVISGVAAQAGAAIDYSVNGSNYAETFTVGTASAYIPVSTVSGLSVYVSGGGTVDNSADGGVNYATAQSTSVIRRNTLQGNTQLVTITSQRLASVEYDSLVPYLGYAAFGLVFQNNTGYALTSFTVGYEAFATIVNQATTSIDTLAFSYGFNPAGGSMAEDATVWTGVSSMDTGFGANTYTVTTSVGTKSVTISGIMWEPGDTLAIRWKDTNIGGIDKGMAIDNIAFSAVPEPGVGGLLAVGALGLMRRRR